MLRYAIALLGILLVACGDDANSTDGPGDGDAGVLDAATVARCATDAECDNDQYCDGEEVCVEGACLPGLPIRCDDGIECTIDACSESLQACESLPPDLDGDGHPDATCEDENGDAFGDDCDDTDPLRFPGNIEDCDDVDDDCNPETLGDKDTDGDGFLDAFCCNDGNCGEDCDDLKPSVNPMATEACDQFDNDCDGDVDEGVSVDMYPDVDRDGHGAKTGLMKRCPGAVGFALEDNDCDDNDPEVFEGQFEICDNKDNNCVGGVDEIHQDAPWFLDLDGDTFGDPTSAPIFSCERVTGRVLSHNDCRDDNAAIHPAAAELCDGFDNDCNGLKDYNLGVNDFEDDDDDDLADDGCGAGAPDCNDTNPSTGVGLDEICDRVDNDCDDKIDEQTAQTVWYLDMDGDGWGVDRGTALARCEPIPGRASNLGDCRDDVNGIHPGAAESCNGLDEDCDGHMDEATDHLCALPNAVAACNFGACDVLACFPGYADADDADVNGCEATASSDAVGGPCSTDADCKAPGDDYCDGREVCVNGSCYPGTAVVCSGPNVLQGNYQISNSFDIQQLASIETITGDLVVLGANALQTLTGLSNLKTIGGKLVIKTSTNLVSLSGLSGLTTVGGDIEITGNAKLTTVDLPSLVTAHSLGISNNALLTNIAGFPNLATVYAAVQVQDNPVLTTISGLSALRSAGSLRIEGNGVLATMSGFGALETILTDLHIHRNAHTAISLPKLKTVNGNLDLEGVAFDTSSPPNLTTTSIALPELDYVGKELLLRELWNLTSLSLPKLRQVDVALRVAGLGSLTSLSLPNLTAVGAFEVLNCGTLATLSVPKLSSVFTDMVTSIPTGTATGDVIISGNLLTGISLPELLTIDGTLNLSPGYYLTDTVLTSVSAPKLHTIGNDVWVSDLQALTTVSMGAVTTVGNYLQFYSCPALASVQMASLATVGGALYLYDTGLTTLATVGLHTQGTLQLQVTGPWVDITYNPMLCQPDVDAYISALTTNGFQGSVYNYGNNDACQ